MSFMFCGCDYLEEIDFKGLDLSKVKDMHCMFCRCTSLIKIDFSANDLSSVKDISQMCDTCSNLVYLDITTMNLQYMDDVSGMLNRCNKLRLIHTPSSQGKLTCALREMLHWRGKTRTETVYIRDGTAYEIITNR